MLRFDRDLIEVYLQPGEVYLARKPTIIRTILGSCVGITFWSSRLAAGALCHALLPRQPGSASEGQSSSNGHRFVDFAIRDLGRRFDKMGALRGEIQVKLFGGADVLPVGPKSSRLTVGRQNCKVALEVLREEGFSVIASSLGGTCGRSIQFNTGTGEVRVRRLSQAVFEQSTEGAAKLAYA
jgi:chemotaxis protein CheD